MSQRISKHFLEKEFACPCCKQVVVDVRLVEALEKLRVACGNKPIIVSSGYRCNKHNKAIGGAPRSYHLKGMAADVMINGMTGKEIAHRAQTIQEFNGIGIGSIWAHVDVRPAPRVMWRYDAKGRKVYGVHA